MDRSAEGKLKSIRKHNDAAKNTSGKQRTVAENPT